MPKKTDYDTFMRWGKMMGCLITVRETHDRHRYAMVTGFTENKRTHLAIHEDQIILGVFNKHGVGVRLHHYIPGHVGITDEDTKADVERFDNLPRIGREKKPG